MRTAEWLYIYGGDEWDSELYDLRADPGETRNVIDAHPDAARALHEQYLAFLDAVDCPASSLACRRAFRPARRTDLPPARLL